MLNLKILHCMSFALYEGCVQEKARKVFLQSVLPVGVFLTHEIMCNVVVVVVVDLGHLAHKKYRHKRLTKHEN